MTFQFDLPPAIEKSLLMDAAQHGENPNSYARQMLIDRYVEVESATEYVPARSPEDFI